MGYILHITRAIDWFDSGQSPITINEWRGYVASDSELRPDGDNGPYDFLFVSHLKEPSPLWWKSGRLYTKNPNRATVQKMIEIAVRLNARVLGDDGEVYTDTSNVPE